MSASNPQPDAPAEPLFQVMAGNPTDEELAVLAAVVVGLSAASADAGDHPSKDQARVHRAWTRRRQLSLRPAPGPGSWRRSYR